MPLVLVTGGAGFIGSRLVSGLVGNGYSVRVLDDLSTGRQDNLSEVAHAVDLRIGDIRDLAVVRDATRGASHVLHFGALPSVPPSILDPVKNAEVNVLGTLSVLLASRDADVKRVVYASSSAVYGNGASQPLVESSIPQPLSPYAASKLAGEHYCAVFSRVYSLETLSLRLFNVFGPRQDPDSPYASVIPRFIARMLNGHPPVIFGDGSQSRDFTFVGDVVQAGVLALEAPASRADGRALNVASGKSISLNELATSLNGILGTHIEPEYSATRPGDIQYSEADINLTRQVIGYEPSVSLDQGLRQTVSWFRE